MCGEDGREGGGRWGGGGVLGESGSNVKGRRDTKQGQVSQKGPNTVLT